MDVVELIYEFYQNKIKIIQLGDIEAAGKVYKQIEKEADTKTPAIIETVQMNK